MGHMTQPTVSQHWRLVNQVQGQSQQAQLTKGKENNVSKKLYYVYSTVNTDDTEALGRQRAKPTKIKARYSRPTCKNCSYLCAPL